MKVVVLAGAARVRDLRACLRDGRPFPYTRAELRYRLAQRAEREFGTPAREFLRLLDRGLVLLRTLKDAETRLN